MVEMTCWTWVQFDFPYRHVAQVISKSCPQITTPKLSPTRTQTEPSFPTLTMSVVSR